MKKDIKMIILALSLSESPKYDERAALSGPWPGTLQGVHNPRKTFIRWIITDYQHGNGIILFNVREERNGGCCNNV